MAFPGEVRIRTSKHFSALYYFHSHWLVFICIRYSLSRFNTWFSLKVGSNELQIMIKIHCVFLFLFECINLILFTKKNMNSLVLLEKHMPEKKNKKQKELLKVAQLLLFVAVFLLGWLETASFTINSNIVVRTAWFSMVSCRAFCHLQLMDLLA